MRRTYLPPILVALLLLASCDKGLPTLPGADLSNKTALAPTGPLKAVRVLTIGGTTIRSYTEPFSETIFPCRELVNINGTTSITSTYSQANGGYKFGLVIAAVGKGFGVTSGDAYTKYYLSVSLDLGRIDDSPEKNFTAVQSYRVTQAGDTNPADDLRGLTYYHIRVNSLGEILELTQESYSTCQ